ncbi:hypothetical protein BpHYR1_034482 [Brachionus plicatilis]|uniref:Uncharacterized protein n=1 Tax=Brachionus plicatilis TaxID=10195 RepID=A0A3M7PE46_BRAPC|nr:hypothetical protein BpHYR1_034482 [Brachionus plicatilis]
MPGLSSKSGRLSSSLSSAKTEEKWAFCASAISLPPLYSIPFEEILAIPCLTDCFEPMSSSSKEEINQESNCNFDYL